MAEQKENLIRWLLQLIESVGTMGEFRRTQRKECSHLIRRMRLFVPLLEEITDLEATIPESARNALLDLKKAFSCARALLKSCCHSSKIYLAVEGEAVMGRFHAVYDKLYHVLDGMAFDQLGVSDEVKEQVELTCMQLKRAKRRVDTQDMELAMDLMVVLSKSENRNADKVIIERLAKKLDLQTLPDLREETAAVQKLVKERRSRNREITHQIVDLLNKFIQMSGFEDINELDAVQPKTKSLQRCPSLQIPNEFLCPISLEIMTDPVIVATGQTYDRSSIQKWLDSGHCTCPKTRQALTHQSLAPNHALANLISQWCKKNNVELQAKDLCSPSKLVMHAEDEIPSLVKDLSSNFLHIQRTAVRKIRLYSKENPDNRILIARNGGIPRLVGLLYSPDSVMQENAVTALLNLSINEANKKTISEEGAIPAVIELLNNGTIEAKENAAATLFSLSMLDDNKFVIGDMNGIPPLICLLQNGSLRGKKDAATALFNLCLNQKNKYRAISAGIVAPLLKLLEDGNLGMIDEALSILLLLASLPEGRSAIGKPSFVEILVKLIRDGTQKNKECAVSLLLELGLHDLALVLAAFGFGVHEPLCEIVRSGTNRAKRKAISLLEYMSRCEQVR
ncbi:U-box domain-containing protein 15 [Dioscorea cayenensis subsp. rotundata]|uniref:U-box domain-containing protein 12 n=1 Tax=Dioscorea cayennensis subsp. rotundata TaxID=55577 RepID=A0AB40D4K3_DIOCR|nr:U-box domain-containing protein 15 [Dioscorea cayenensis subsp. rotundata]